MILNNFVVDISSMEEAIEEYKKSIKSLKETKSAIDNSLDYLKKGTWEGAAKEKFFSLNYNKWQDSLIKRLDKLELMVSALTECKNEIESLKNEGEALVNLL